MSTDSGSRAYRKTELVHVTFAGSGGELQSSVGPNRYAAGDALITGSNGDHWCVARQRFDLKYEPVAPLKHGEDGAYRNRPASVLARQMRAPFTVARCDSGDVLHGAAGDWLVEYAPGDCGIVDDARFCLVYRAIDSADPPR